MNRHLLTVEHQQAPRWPWTMQVTAHVHTPVRSCQSISKPSPRHAFCSGRVLPVGGTARCMVGPLWAVAVDRHVTCCHRPAREKRRRASTSTAAAALMTDRLILSLFEPPAGGAADQISSRRPLPLFVIVAYASAVPIRCLFDSSRLRPRPE
jgi:hypothetical protein